jgi:hypothetical protein
LWTDRVRLLIRWSQVRILPGAQRSDLGICLVAAALLAEANMLAWTHAATCPTMSRSRPTRASPSVGRTPEHIADEHPLRMRFPVTTPPDGGGPLRERASVSRRVPAAHVSSSISPYLSPLSTAELAQRAPRTRLCRASPGKDWQGAIASRSREPAAQGQPRTSRIYDRAGEIAVASGPTNITGRRGNAWPRRAGTKPD